MALSNPLAGERRPGYVGQPLPGVEVRLVDDDGQRRGRRHAGRARGPRSGGLPRVLAAAGRDARRRFATAGSAPATWPSAEQGAYRLLGRTSVDIIKTGGYKVSALEIEEILRTHPAIAECAVVGVSDEDWGERVSAAVELRSGASLSLDELQQWAKVQLAPVQGAARSAGRVRAAAQRHGQGRQAGSCRPVQIGLTSGHGPAPRHDRRRSRRHDGCSPSVWRTPSATSAKAATPRVSRRRRCPTPPSSSADWRIGASEPSRPASGGRPTTRTPRST